MTNEVWTQNGTIWHVTRDGAVIFTGSKPACERFAADNEKRMGRLHAALDDLQAATR